MKRAAFLCSLALASCGAPDDRPRAAASAAVAAESPAAARTWPAMLQHCQRSPVCDPLSDFGSGAGQASGVTGATAWFAQAESVGGPEKASANEPGGYVLLSVFGPRGEGGEGGRPLTLDEIPSSLRTGRDRKSWLSVQFRAGTDGKMQPETIIFMSAHLAIGVPGAETAKTSAELSTLTRDHVSGLSWPGGERGARVEISAGRTVLLRAHETGVSAGARTPEAQALKQGFTPWSIQVQQAFDPDAHGDLLAAMRAGRSLSLRVSSPGGVMLQDGLYTTGFADALMLAAAALRDDPIAIPLPERCAPTASEPDSFWLHADVSPALLACDPRTPEQRYTDEAKARADG